MNIDDTISHLSNASIPDRLRAITAIWDSIPAESVPSPTPEQQAELDRRLVAHAQNPSSAISHDELKRRLDARE